MRTSLLLTALPLALLGCPTDEDPGDPPASSLTCPEPGPLPFETQTTDWTSPGSGDAFGTTQPGYGGLDLLGPQAGTVTAQGVMGRNERFLTEPVAGEWVSVWAHDATDGWSELGRGRTDFDAGAYAVDVPAAGLPEGDGRFFAVLEGAGHCADHGVFPWPAGRRVIVTDIDGTLTLSDDELTAEFADPDYVQQAWPGAVELTTTWAAKGYGVVYVTARPHHLRSLTRPWLDELDFAYGPVSTAPELVFGPTAADYKAEFLGRVQDTLGWEIVAAYGNADSDIEAYERAGIPKSVTFIIGPEGGNADTVAVSEGWDAHLAEFVRPFPDAR